MTRAASLFMYGQQISALPGVTSVLSPFTLTGLSDPTAMAALWPQFEGLLNDPDGFVVPRRASPLIRARPSPPRSWDSSSSSSRPPSPRGRSFSGLSQPTLRPPPSHRTWSDGYWTQVHQRVPGTRSRGVGLQLRLLPGVERLVPLVIAWVVVISLVCSCSSCEAWFYPCSPSSSISSRSPSVGAGWYCSSSKIRSSGCYGSPRPGRWTWSSGGHVVHTVRDHHGLRGVHADSHARNVGTGHKTTGRVSPPAGADGRVILSAALLVVIVTGAFAFTSIAETKMLGLGIALAIIVDALLVRMLLLLPSWSTWAGPTVVPSARTKQPRASTSRPRPAKRRRLGAPRARSPRLPFRTRQSRSGEILLEVDFSERRALEDVLHMERHRAVEDRLAGNTGAAQHRVEVRVDEGSSEWPRTPGTNTVLTSPW